MTRQAGQGTLRNEVVISFADGMDENPDIDSDLERLRNMPVRSEDIGYSPEEMLSCAKCAKPNAPDRSGCLYCGAPLVGGAAPKLEHRELEGWENGFNVVVTARSGDAIPDRASQKLAGVLGVDPETLVSILRFGAPVPIARVESEKHAEHVAAILAEFGIGSTTIPDVALRSAKPPQRLRGIGFTDDKLALQLFNVTELYSLDRDDLALIVAGVVRETRTESMEKRKRRTTKTLSETQTSSDESVIDIYSKRDAEGWRIRAHGFDFSSLGPDKSLVAAENMRTMLSRLAGVSGAVKLVEDFASVGPLLEYCWPSETRRDALGLQRSGFARKDFASLSTTSNASQFVKYSRLQWHLL